MLRGALSIDSFAAHSEFIAGAAISLVAHYYDPRLSNDVQDVVTDDWIATLEPFSERCIREARRRWIDRERIRPTPADIKALCWQVAAGH
jgi:hypothetical protein